MEISSEKKEIIKPINEVEDPLLIHAMKDLLDLAQTKKTYNWKPGWKLL